MMDSKRSILFVSFTLALAWSFAASLGALAQNQPEDTLLKVAVVGDTGIGERAFHPGFLAVQRAMREKHPDLLLHLGDFVYQPEKFPETCPQKYIREIRTTLVAPYPYRLFVPGDNDLPPKLKKPKASGCWEHIDPMDTPFDEVTPQGPKPGNFEGSKIIGNAFFAVLSSSPWQDPTPWLKPRIEDAKRRGLWIVLAVHEPAITTAWFLDKRNTELKQINALGPDLVLSGNQHSYERFYALGIPGPGGELPVKKSSVYQRGDGAIHLISGGGGATFKPFADMQGKKKRTAPKEVFDALKVRALMNHFVWLEITAQSLKATTYRVCAGKEVETKKNPRWKPDKSVWKKIRLECEGEPAGAEEFDRFEIQK